MANKNRGQFFAFKRFSDRLDSFYVGLEGKAGVEYTA